jgi:hypothetical protein
MILTLSFLKISYCTTGRAYADFQGKENSLRILESKPT